MDCSDIFDEKDRRADEAGCIFAFHDQFGLDDGEDQSHSYGGVLFCAFFSSCYVAVTQRPCGWLRMALSASGLAFAYAAFRLLALFDPVWIWLDGQWMLGWWMALISSLFHRRISARLLCLALGGCQGEVVYAMSILRMAPGYVLGSFSFLDALAISASSLLVWESIRFFSLQLEEKRPVRRTRQP